jgi:hypothetical protein
LDSRTLLPRRAADLCCLQRCRLLLDRTPSTRVNSPAAFAVASTIRPHVTAAVAHEAFVKQLKAEPFQAFDFKPDGVSIYQLGNFGTASKQVWQSAASGTVR